MPNNNLLLQGLTESFYDYLERSTYGPVDGIYLAAGGSGYSNGDAVVFTRSPNDTETQNAIATVVTSSAGAISSIVLTNSGLYSIVPSLSITSVSGTGANVYCTIDADSYYLFASGIEPFNDEPTVDPVSTSYGNTVISNHQQMVFGKKIDKTSLSLVIPNRQWTSGTVYSQYDNTDSNLSVESFYVVNHVGIVYKCINNAQGQPSTVEPTETQALAYPPALADGYQWMYLYTLPGGLPSSNTIPVIQEANTSNAAISGAIYSVRVASSGSGYPTANGTIVSVNANGVGSVFLSTPPVVYTNYYQGCFLTVWGNGGVVNNFAILNSVSAGSYQQVSVAGNFNANQINSGYQFQIGPSVQVLGDGSGFSAYAKVSSVNGGISDVHVLNSGDGYHYADALITTPSMFGSNASLVAIISPLNGHGSNVASELFSNTISISSGFSNTDPNFYPLVSNTTLKYRTIGILKNPKTFGSNSVFTNTSFNQRVLLAFDIQMTPFFEAGEIIVGSSRDGQAVVVASNPSTGLVEVTGWDGVSIQVGETITGQKSGTVLVLNNVTGAPTLEPFSGDVIYLSNFTAITHSNTTPSDSFQILISQ